jgi:hypothetical protein
MKFRQLQLACSCGQVPDVIHQVGLTSEYELVIHWTCSECGQLVYAVKSLADCCRECPEAEPSEEVPEMPTRFGSHASDTEFLRSMGISA